MSGIVQCSRCKKTIMDEEFAEHYCSPRMKGNKTLFIDAFLGTAKDEQGREFTLAMGMDGIMYTLVKVPRDGCKIPIAPNEFDSEDTKRGFDRT